MIFFIFLLVNFIFIVGFNVFIYRKANPNELVYDSDYIDNNYKKILFLILVPVICDIFFILYRFRNRINYLDFEVFVGFFLFFSYLFVLAIITFDYVLSNQQKAALYMTKKRGADIIYRCIYNLSHGGDWRFFVLELRIYKKFEAFYRSFSLKPQFSAICFVLIPWILFVFVFLYEIWKGQGFWLVLYCVGIRVTLFRLHNVIDYCCSRALIYHVDENLMNTMNRENFAQVRQSKLGTVVFCQDLEAIEDEFFIGFSYLSFTERLSRWCGFKGVITFSSLVWF